MLWFRENILYVLMALGIFVLSVGCGDFGSGKKSIEESIAIMIPFQTQGTTLVGQGEQVVNAPTSLDKIRHFKLAMDDGFGSQVVLASSDTRQEFCQSFGVSCIKLENTWGSYNPDGTPYVPAAVIPFSGNQFRVTVDLVLANANPTGQALQSPITLFLIIEREAD